MVKTFPRHAQEFFPHSQKHLTTVLCTLQTSKPNCNSTQLHKENQLELNAIDSSWPGINAHVLAANVLLIPNLVPFKDNY